MQFGWKQGVITLVFVSVVGAGFILSPATVIERVQTVLHSPWFPAVLLGLYLLRPFLGWPITALSVLVGYQYGILAGVPIAIVGAVGSTLIPYTGMRYFEFDSGILEWATEEFFSATGDFRGMIAARIAPVPAEATSLAAGAAEVRPLTFVLGTAIGEIPWAIAAVTIGHSMYRLTLSEVSFSPWLIAATAIAAVVLVAGPAYRLLRHTARGKRTDRVPHRSGDPPR